MTANRRLGLKLGLLALLMGLPAVINLEVVPNALIVSGDAAASSASIVASEMTWRIGILAGLVSGVGFLLYGLALYDLFEDVDRKQARLLLTMVIASVAVGLANLVHMIVPLVLLSGADYLATFSASQRETLAYGFLRLHNTGQGLEMAFWGLWLFPFGVLVRRSGFFPRILGTFLVIGCFAYLAASFTTLVLPELRSVVWMILMPLFALAELPILLWFFIKGVNVPAREAPPAPAAPAAIAAS